MRPSPLQNRVAPDGTIHARSERGLLTGNRGVIHLPGFRLGRSRWRGKAWIACLTDFRGRRRSVMGEGWTELFFLDEVTALAAGHRPCFFCRREEARAFAAAWGEAAGEPVPRAPAMDAVLHAERLAPPDEAEPASLPQGAVFRDGDRFLASREGRLLEWSFSGWRPAATPAPGNPCPVVTPRAIRAVLAQDYRPIWHPSADAAVTA